MATPIGEWLRSTSGSPQRSGASALIARDWWHRSFAALWMPEAKALSISLTENQCPSVAITLWGTGSVGIALCGIPEAGVTTASLISRLSGPLAQLERGRCFIQIGCRRRFLIRNWAVPHARISTV